LNKKVGIDWLVAGARADATLAERVAWLEQFMDWVRAGGRSGRRGRSGARHSDSLLPAGAGAPSRSPHRRGADVRNTLRELNAIALLCETGLPRANAFFQELSGRLASKLLPRRRPKTTWPRCSGAHFPRKPTLIG
jgi:site-specific recombinase